MINKEGINKFKLRAKMNYLMRKTDKLWKREENLCLNNFNI
jgi:hypothetical protein